MARRRKVPVASGPQLLVLLAVVVLALWLVSGNEINLEILSVESLVLPVVLVGVILGVGLVLVMKLETRRRERALEVADIDRMDGVVFEEYVAKLMRFRGYSVKMTKKTGDYGVDLLADKGGEHLAIQLKRYEKSVDREAVNDAVSGKNAYRTDAIPMVITNSKFTKEAREIARLNNCRLVDREELIKWILDYQKS